MTSNFVLKICPLCGFENNKIHYRYSRMNIVSCVNCKFHYQNPQPSDIELNNIYHSGYFFGSDDVKMSWHVSDLKTSTAQQYFNILSSVNIHEGNILEIGCGDGYLLKLAQDLGYQINGIEYSESAVSKANSLLKNCCVHCIGSVVADNFMNKPAQFDICILADVIEHIRDPITLLYQIHKILKPGAVILLATPSLDSLTAKLMSSQWLEFKREHLFYFSRRTITDALVKTGYHNITLLPGYKVVSFDYIFAHFMRFKVIFITKILQLVNLLLPSVMKRYKWRLSGSGLVCIAYR